MDLRQNDVQQKDDTFPINDVYRKENAHQTSCEQTMVSQSRRHESLLHCLRAAWRGLGIALRCERNVRSHLACTIIALAAGLWWRIEPWEWMAIILVVALVWSMELINTTLEMLADKVHPDRHPLIGTVKDIAAGAVLVAAISAIAVSILVFGPRFWP